jgi:predicted Zn-dependent protease
MMMDTGGVALGVATSGLTGLAVSQLYQMSSGMVGLSFDRKKESEADHIGLIYMARAGYNPQAAIDLWEKMDKLESGKSIPPEWLSTHPSHIDRLTHLYKWQPEAQAVYEKAKDSHL